MAQPAAREPGHSRIRFTKPEKSWILYDWANSVYATNMMAAIFPIYYASSPAMPGTNGGASAFPPPPCSSQ